MSQRAAWPFCFGLIVAVVVVAGCGGKSALPLQAEQSVRMLPKRVRPAAQILVRLERAIRNQDARTLCTDIYERASIGDTIASCIRGATQGVRSEKQFTLRVRRVVLTRDAGTAFTDVTFRDDRGTHHLRQIIQLVRSDTGWKVKLVS